MVYSSLIYECGTVMRCYSVLVSIQTVEMGPPAYDRVILCTGFKVSLHQLHCSVVDKSHPTF